MSETKIIIHRDPPDHQAAGKFTQAAATAKAVGDQIRNRRAAIHQQAKVDAGAADIGEVPQESVAAPEREDIESIEITLRDGRVVEYGPPGNISLSDRIARLYSARSIAEGGPDPGMTEYRLTRLLMGVRAINGKSVHSLTNLVERTRLANILGDQAIDLLNLFDNRHWPPLTEAELPVVKKNLRQPGL